MIATFIVFCLLFSLLNDDESRSSQCFKLPSALWIISLRSILHSKPQGSTAAVVNCVQVGSGLKSATFESSLHTYGAYVVKRLDFVLSIGRRSPFFLFAGSLLPYLIVDWNDRWSHRTMRAINASRGIKGQRISRTSPG
jgi:hypothetical protein